MEEDWIRPKRAIPSHCPRRSIKVEHRSCGYSRFRCLSIPTLFLKQLDEISAEDNDRAYTEDCNANFDAVEEYTDKNTDIDRY